MSTATKAFSLTGPGTSEIVTAQNMATLSPLAPTGREYIPGTFSFVLNSNNQTVVTFIPSRVLRKNTTYNVLLLGASGSLTSNGVRNPAFEGMLNSYEWSFTTGTVDITVLPTWSLSHAGNQAPRARLRHRHRRQHDYFLLLTGQQSNDNGWANLWPSVARGTGERGAGWQYWVFLDQELRLLDGYGGILALDFVSSI